MSILSVRSISKHYAAQTALNKVSIEVPEHSIFGLLGPNGAGKTTLIRIINQITGPDEGEIILNGKRLNPEHSRLIGYLPEERGLYKKMNVGEQALYLAQLKGLTRHDATVRLKHWFEKFEIQAWWNKKVEELSKGMQQKMQFIVTIVHEPELLIFDEPFSGFDPINVNLLKDEILELKRKGAAIIFSTHNMASVEELCDNIALINKANKILDGSVTDVRRKYASNAYEITYKAANGLASLLDGRFQVQDIPVANGTLSSIIKLPAGATANELINRILPHAEIISFNEVIPSMNDIFIQAVNSENANQLL